MDRELLLGWKLELEANISELEKRFSELELELRMKKEQLGAIAVLLSNGEAKRGIKIMTSAISTETDAIANFLPSLKSKGWSIEHRSGRLNMYTASRGSKEAALWIKYSKYNEGVDYYWFGIDPENLEGLGDKVGGVILLLGAADRYLCFPFMKLRELLKRATKAKTGQKFTVRERGERVRLLPGGTGEWIDVSQFYNDSGLQKLGLA